MGNINYSSLKKYLFHKILWEICLFFHNQLTTKAHKYHQWQNSSFCSDDQAQRKLDYKVQQDQPNPHTESSSWKLTWSDQPNLSTNNWSLSYQVPTCLNQIRRGHVSLKGWILPSQAEIPSFLMWHKAEMDVTESWKASTSCHFFLLHPFNQELGAAMPRPLKLLKPLEISLFS